TFKERPVLFDALTGGLLVREEAFAFRCAVRMLVANILINASVSSRSGSNSVGALINGTRLASRNQRRLSFSSLKQMLNLWMKSFRDSEARASPWFESGEVPQRSNCPAM